MIGIGVNIFSGRKINRPNAKMTLTSTGDGSGVSTLRMSVSENTTLTIVGDANFYTNSNGTLGESKTWAITTGALRDIYLRCTGNAVINIPDRRVVTQVGSTIGFGWVSPTNGASLAFAAATFVNLISLSISGTSVITGALPAGLTSLRLVGSTISWTYSGALPNGLTFLLLSGNSINWTGLDIGNNGNVSTMSLYNYRISKMSSADMVTLLTQMTNRTGSLPSSITINDYADFASPPQFIVDAVDLLKTTKSVTTVSLGG
jgi:hypothetical protein